MWTVNFQMFKLILEEAEEPEIKLPSSAGSSKKQDSSRKTSISALLTAKTFEENPSELITQESSLDTFQDPVIIVAGRDEIARDLHL